MVTLTELAQILKIAWSADTAGGDTWDPSRPSLNQCAATALVVQDFFGGELFRCEMSNGDSHYWNLVDGGEIDLTGDQFEVADGKPLYDTTRLWHRQQLLQSPQTIKRYGLLLRRISAVMERQQHADISVWYSEIDL